MQIIDSESINSIKSATEVLNQGGVLVFPTDTVYGIGCVLRGDAIKKLYTDIGLQGKYRLAGLEK